MFSPKGYVVKDFILIIFFFWGGGRWGTPYFVVDCSRKEKKIGLFLVSTKRKDQGFSLLVVMDLPLPLRVQNCSVSDLSGDH